MKRVRLKEWMLNESARLGIGVTGVHMRISRGWYKGLAMFEKVHHSEVWVIPLQNYPVPHSPRKDVLFESNYL